MSLAVPSALVDALPTQLWSLGNLYRVFGRTLHFCVGDGQRTIELDGNEIGHGRKPFAEFHDAPSDRASDLAWRVDLGWTALLASAIVLVAVIARVARPASRDIQQR